MSSRSLSSLLLVSAYFTGWFPDRAATSPDADHVFTYHPGHPGHLGHLGLATETITIDPDGSGSVPP